MANDDDVVMWDYKIIMPPHQSIDHVAHPIHGYP